MLTWLTPGKALSDELIALIHEPTVDPNFLALACRTSAELQAKTAEGKMLADRKEALARYVEEAKKLASNAVTAAFEQKMVVFL